MDIPAPILNPLYYKILKTVGEKSKEVAENVMKGAAERIIQYNMEVDPESIDAEPDGNQIASIAVSLDGTWQKRGKSSKHGVVSLIAVDTGEVLDNSVKTLCRECTIHQNDKDITKYKEWYEKHNPECFINYKGTSGAMENEAGVEMFLCSIETRYLKIYFRGRW